MLLQNSKSNYQVHLWAKLCFGIQFCMIPIFQVIKLFSYINKIIFVLYDTLKSYLEFCYFKWKYRKTNNYFCLFCNMIFDDVIYSSTIFQQKYVCKLQCEIMNASQGDNLNLLETHTHQLIQIFRLCYFNRITRLSSIFSAKTIILW